MTEREKVIRGLEACALKQPFVDCKNCPYHGGDTCIGPLMRDALALLREQEPRVMKYDEMIVAGKENRAVYLEAAPEFGLKPRWGIATEGMEPPVERAFTYPGGTAFNAEAANEIMYDGDFYNKNMNLGWRAWTAPPTEEQRKAAKWDDGSKKSTCSDLFG